MKNFSGNITTRVSVFFMLLLCFLDLNIYAYPEIRGKLNIDTTWNRVVYLSIIPSLEQLNSISNQMIIEKSDLDKNGRFSFRTDYLPVENYVYRIHISKKGDPPASLIIGGKDENHTFLIANNQSYISVNSINSISIFGEIEIKNSLRSQLLNEVDKMVLFVDTTNFNSSSLKRELMENALDEKLRRFADTCSFPLVALYAIYKSNFETNISENPNFYNRFLEKWTHEKSLYFEEFRKRIPVENQQRNYSFLFGISGLLLGAILTLFIQKIIPRKTNPLLELTIQERKIFSLLENEKSNKEISDELNISLSTVKSHVNNIFSKLNLKSRKEILSYK